MDAILDYLLFPPRFVVVAAQFCLRVQSQDETHKTDETDIVPVFRGSFLLSTMHLLTSSRLRRQETYPYHVVTNYQG